MMKQNENEMNFSVPLEIIKASEIEPKEVKWLWYPYIPFGKVTFCHVPNVPFSYSVPVTVMRFTATSVLALT